MEEVFKEVLSETTCTGLDIGEYLYTEPVEVKIRSNKIFHPIEVTVNVFRGFFTCDPSDPTASYTRYGDIAPWFDPKRFEEAAKFHNLNLKRIYKDALPGDQILSACDLSNRERVKLDIESFPSTVMYLLKIQGKYDTSFNISYHCPRVDPLEARVLIFLKGRKSMNLREEHRESHTNTERIEGGSVLHQFITQLKDE